MPSNEITLFSRDFKIKIPAWDTRSQMLSWEHLNVSIKSFWTRSYRWVWLEKYSTQPQAFLFSFPFTKLVFFRWLVFWPQSPCTAAPIAFSFLRQKRHARSLGLIRGTTWRVASFVWFRFPWAFRFSDSWDIWDALAFLSDGQSTTFPDDSKMSDFLVCSLHLLMVNKNSYLVGFSGF